MNYLPILKEELEGQADIILISGEAYCDHPSFGHAIISRFLQYLGFNVAIIPQPLKDADYKRFGEPKYGFMISPGVVDSMVNNYTVAKFKRDRDVYSENGKTGMRPDRACIVYTKNLKRLFPNSAIVIGGIEASLRRFSHYDYWSDSVMSSVLEDSGADLLIYGMGERPLMDIAELLYKGVPLKNIKDVRGCCYIADYSDFSKSLLEEIDNRNAIYLPSNEEVSRDNLSYIKAFNIQNANTDYITAKKLIQKQSKKYLVQNLPQLPLSEKELDVVYNLPYMRNYHPSYTLGVPAIEEVKFSILSHRGCFGGCNYCALTYHQGKLIQKRSKENIVAEAKLLTEMQDFKGYIHDVGGPTANFRNPSCEKQIKSGICAKKTCIGYSPCENLEVDHTEYLQLLRELRAIPKVKKVFIRSGIRFDYIMKDKNEEFLNELIQHHISGQLKVAPEHSEDKVLKLMNKPKFEVYLRFKDKYDNINKKLGLKQFLVPYLISSHPGCTLNDAINLSMYLKKIGYMPEQVQDFYPTPSTKSTCMYYTGVNPDDMQTVYVAKTKEEKAMQRSLMQYRKKENYNIIKDALIKANRTDLIGFTEKSLIKPLASEAGAVVKTKNYSNVGKTNSVVNKHTNERIGDKRFAESDKSIKTKPLSGSSIREKLERNNQTVNKISKDSSKDKRKTQSLSNGSIRENIDRNNQTVNKISKDLTGEKSSAKSFVKSNLKTENASIKFDRDNGKTLSNTKSSGKTLNNTKSSGKTLNNSKSNEKTLSNTKSNEKSLSNTKSYGLNKKSNNTKKNK